MLAITHFAVGLIVAVLFIIPVVERFEDATVIVASGLWALGPDVNKFITEASFLHDSLWANVFWLHPTMDAFETGFPNVEALIVLSMLFAAIVLSERKRNP